MPIDSTANLLFSIGANSDDAENNIKRFRTLLGKDLNEISGEFADWSKEVFGSLTTVQGATTAAVAAVGAAAVALGAVMQESANKYAEYVTEVDRGSRVTGISVEKMSGLKFAAAETQTSYEALTTGLTRFATTVAKAAEGSEAQTKSFERLGISHDQVRAGEKDLMPLLEAVADRFHGMASQVEKTAAARELFGRGGAELNRMLSQGAEGIREFNREAAAMGLTITTKDVVGVNEYKAAIEKAKAEQEALNVTMGRNSIGILEILRIEWAGLIQTVRDGGVSAGIGGFFAMWKANNVLLLQQIRDLANALANLGHEGGAPPPAETPKKLKEEYAGLSELLSEVRGKVWEIVGGEQGKIDTEIEHLNDQLVKANNEFVKLKNEGKLSAEQIATEAAALAALPNSLQALANSLQDAYGDKLRAAIRSAGEDLQELALHQGRQTMAVKDALITMDVAKRRAAMEREHTDTVENLAWLAAYERAARRQITIDKLAEIDKTAAEIEGQARAANGRNFEVQRQALAAEMSQRREAMHREETDTEENLAALAAYEKNARARIDADQKAAYDTELARLGEQLERIQQKEQTHYERIQAEYAADVAKFSAAEERKALAAAFSFAQVAAIHAQFEAIRKGLFDREQLELQQLQNSTGWRGVFGNEFAQMIRQDEVLAKEWATSQQQAHLMVKVSLESLKEMGQETFQQFAQAEGQAIASALVYSKSIGEAMKQALAATLESLSARALSQAIYSLALGFLSLAEGDPAGAAAAFEAAALFGAVGVAAGLGGRAVAGGGGSGAAAAGGSAGTGSQAQASMADQQSGAVGGTAATGGPHVTVNVYGHVVGTSGVTEFVGLLNDAVLNSDAQLTATNTKTGVQVNR